jgi:hypothetical protein
MILRQNWLETARWALIVTTALAAAAIVATSPLPADARGGHGFGGHGMGRAFGGHGMPGAHSAGGGRRHGNDSYMKAASDDRDKLLNTQIKSICRGC